MLFYNNISEQVFVSTELRPPYLVYGHRTPRRGGGARRDISQMSRKLGTQLMALVIYRQRPLSPLHNTN